MASGSPTWDLSDNDIAALKTVLAAAEALETARTALADTVQGYRNILEFRRTPDGRYGALTREELEQCMAIKEAALAAIDKDLEGGSRCTSHRSMNGCELPEGHEGWHKAGGLAWPQVIDKAREGE